MSEMKYSVTLMRHNTETDDVEELVDIWIEPDDAVTLAVQLKQMELVMATPLDDSLEEAEEVEEVEEDEEEPAPAPKKRASKWDKERAKDLINTGLSAQDVADQIGTSIGNIYQLKSVMKKDGELVDITEKKVRIPSKPHFSNTDKVKQMVIAGKNDTEIYNEMHDCMTDGELREALEMAKS